MKWRTITTVLLLLLVSGSYGFDKQKISTPEHFSAVWRKRDETENDDGVCGVRVSRWSLFCMRRGESQRRGSIPDAAYRES